MTQTKRKVARQEGCWAIAFAWPMGNTRRMLKRDSSASKGKIMEIKGGTVPKAALGN